MRRDVLTALPLLAVSQQLQSHSAKPELGCGGEAGNLFRSHFKHRLSLSLSSIFVPLYTV